MRTPNGALTVAGAATGDLSGTVTSDPLKVNYLTELSVSFTVTSASGLTSAAKLQGSNDAGLNVDGNPQNVTGVTNWADITNATATLNANGTKYIAIADVPFRWVRAVCTNSAGTGTVAMRFQGKGQL